MQLPEILRAALAESARSVSSLAFSVTDVSKRYRRETDQSLQIRSEDEASAYLAYRFPATYCAVASVLRKLQQIIPDLMPVSLLDAGAGPATATLAAFDFWPSLEKATLIEPNNYLRAAGENLLGQIHPDKNISWSTQRLGSVQSPVREKHDVVIISYMLNEIADEDEKAFRNILEEMWAKTNKILIVLEPGTPHGQKTVLQARELLLKQGGNIAGPCTHEKPCPVAAQFKGDEKWCHFSVRVERSKLHKRSKEQATLAYEDEKFSYVVFSKEKVSLPEGRIIGHPRGTKVIQTELCSADGTVKKLSLAKSSPDYKKLRGAEWGDGW